MKEEINIMISQPEALSAAYFWLVIYGIAALIFFSIGVWVIVRGGKDVLEILSGSIKSSKQR